MTKAKKLTSPWNEYINPISSRLRDHQQLLNACDQKYMMYNPETGQYALLLDTYVVNSENPVYLKDRADPIYEEDRYVQYLCEEKLCEDFSVGLDDEGWLWVDELYGTVDGGAGEAHATGYLYPGAGSLEALPTWGTKV